MDEVEFYEDEVKRHEDGRKKKQQKTQEKLKALYLSSACRLEQSIQSLQTHKADMEAVLVRIRDHEQPILHTIMRGRRSISLDDEEEQNAEMGSTIEAVTELLSVFHTSFLHPMHENELEIYPMFEKSAVELAAKAYFIKTSYDIKPKSSIKRARSI